MHVGSGMSLSFSHTHCTVCYTVLGATADAEEKRGAEHAFATEVGSHLLLQYSTMIVFSTFGIIAEGN